VGRARSGPRDTCAKRPRTGPQAVSSAFGGLPTPHRSEDGCGTIFVARTRHEEVVEVAYAATGATEPRSHAEAMADRHKTGASVRCKAGKFYSATFRGRDPEEDYEQEAKDQRDADVIWFRMATRLEGSARMRAIQGLKIGRR